MSICLNDESKSGNIVHNDFPIQLDNLRNAVSNIFPDGYPNCSPQTKSGNTISNSSPNNYKINCLEEAIDFVENNKRDNSFSHHTSLLNKSWINKLDKLSDNDTFDQEDTFLCNINGVELALSNVMFIVSIVSEIAGIRFEDYKNYFDFMHDLHYYIKEYDSYKILVAHNFKSYTTKFTSFNCINNLLPRLIEVRHNRHLIIYDRIYKLISKKRYLCDDVFMLIMDFVGQFVLENVACKHCLINRESIDIAISHCITKCPYLQHIDNGFSNEIHNKKSIIYSNPNENCDDNDNENCDDNKNCDKKDNEEKYSSEWYKSFIDYESGSECDDDDDDDDYYYESDSESDYYRSKRYYYVHNWSNYDYDYVNENDKYLYPNSNPYNVMEFCKHFYYLKGSYVLHPWK